MMPTTKRYDVLRLARWKPLTSAASNVAGLAMTPVASVLAMLSARACESTKMIKVTTTDPEVILRVMALVDTPASSARTVMIDICAASS